MRIFILFFILNLSLISESELSLGTYSGTYNSIKKNNSQINNIPEFKKSIFNKLVMNFTKNSNSNNRLETNIFYDINISLLSNLNNDKKIEIYLDENSFFGYKLKKFNIKFGRKLYGGFYNYNNNWKDGCEGISLDTSFEKLGKLNLYFFDFYRAYPLLKNQFFSETDKPLLPENIKYRSGFEYDFTNKYLYINFNSQFFNLGNWGRYSLDNQEKKGDGDYLYTNSISLTGKFSSLSLGINFLLSRGVDKTPYNPIRKTKNIPISGEAIYLNLGYDYQKFHIHLGFFLPDTEQKNREGEIFQYGYVGSGAFFSEGFLISKVLNFIPGVWITSEGLERSLDFENGRQNSFYQKLKIIYNHPVAKFNLINEYFLPYRDKMDSDGRVHLEKKYFSKNFISEISLNMESPANYTGDYFYKLQLSKLISSKDISLEATSVYVSAGLIL